MEVSTFIREGVDGSDYGRGELETLHASTNNILASFTKLVEVLNAKDIISENEIFYIIKGYRLEDDV